jgi:hypothetical protein
MKSRLRHPIRAIREPFGKAGLTVAILALVFAMVGGAYAAKGALTGKQKKEVEKIAKTEAKKFVITSTSQIKPSVLESSGPKATASAKGKQGKQGKQGKTGKTGPQGPAGATGPAGPQGAKGDTGANGKDGANGTNGKEGLEGKAGKNGTTGFTEMLPSGKTETGTWA